MSHPDGDAHVHPYVDGASRVSVLQRGTRAPLLDKPSGSEERWTATMRNVPASETGGDLSVRGSQLPGLLRLFVIFHESEVLGAGMAALRTLPALREYGWTASGWFPGRGAMIETAEPSLAGCASAAKPIAFSRRTWRSDPGVLARLRATPEYLRALRLALLASRPHVVHANTLLALPEAIVARRLGLPVVLHVHEMPPPGLKRSAALLLAARVADVIVTVSNSVHEMVVDHVRDKPVLTVLNGVPEVEPSPPPAGPCTFGTVAAVSRVKGTDIFLRAAQLAARQRPELRFEHVGPADLHGDPMLTEEIASLLSSPELKNSLRMLGRRKATELLPHWHGFVLASRQEAFPLATLEAMAAGLPVIATAVGGVPEQIEHMKTGILAPPEDPQTLAEAILRLHDDVGLRIQLGRDAARSVRARFTIARQADGLHRAYLAALNLRHGHPALRREAIEALRAP